MKTGTNLTIRMDKVKGNRFLELIQQDVGLTKVGTTQGGEFAGQCPKCGGPR